MGLPQISALIPSLDGTWIGAFINSAFGIGNMVVEPAADFFATIANYLAMFWDTLQGTVANVGAVMRTVFTAVIVTNTIQPYIWAPIAASMTIVVLVSVVKLILGWGNT